MTGRHPDFGALCAWVEEDLQAERRTQLSEHIAGCDECQSTVRTLRAIGTTASQFSAPSPPEDLWEGIVERRERGDRVLLPTDPEDVDAEETTRGSSGFVGLSRWATGVAALLIGAAAGVWFVQSQPAEAGQSSLEFTPSAPKAGSVVSAVYHAGALLAAADTLRLRARFRGPWSQWYNRGAMQTTVARLERRENGDFVGQFQLPDSIVYGAFAVENLAGTTVDANQSQLWEVIVRDSAGTPLFQALRQQVADLVGRAWPTARTVARRTTELYPERPVAWNSLALFQRRANAERLPDTLRAFHRQQFERFDGRLRPKDSLPASRVHAMTLYAMTVQDSAGWEYWEQRLETEHPCHPSVLFRSVDVSDRRAHPERYLTRLEEVWPKLKDTRTGSRRTKRLEQQSFINNALTYSRMADSARAYLRWVQRYRKHARVTPVGVAHNAEWMIDQPTIRDAGMEWLRSWIARLDAVPDSFRLLRNSVSQQRIEFRDLRQSMLAFLGKGLLARGDTSAAMDTLAVAMREGWNPQAFRRLGQIHWSVGDTAEAVSAYARVAADPEASLIPSVQSRIESIVDSTAWREHVRRARREMVREVMAGAEYTRLHRPIHLRSLSGERRTLQELSEGRITLVAFFDRDIYVQPKSLARLDTLAKDLSEQGIRVVTIAESGPVKELRQFLADYDLDYPVYLDPDGEAKDAFNNVSVPDYYLLDSSGRIVFGGNDLEFRDVRRTAVALRSHEGSRTVTP